MRKLFKSSAFTCSILILLATGSHVFGDSNTSSLENICDRQNLSGESLKFSSFYLDPNGVPLHLVRQRADSADTHELQIRAVCHTAARQVELLKSQVAPPQCKGLVDAAPGNIDDGIDVLNLPWDPRRCLSAASVGSFKGVLRQAFSARYAQTGAYHRYSRAEMQYFLNIVGSGCKGTSTLYERYSCWETSGERLYAQYRSAKSKLELLKAPASANQACEVLRAQKLSPDAIEFLAQVARNQFRPKGVSAKDYPGYRDCRGYDFGAMLSKCSETKLDADALGCLNQALTYMGEDTEKFTRDPLGSSATGPYRFSQTLAVLRQKALELSVFSRLCASGLKFDSLFSKKPSLSDKETRERCFVDEITKLNAISDFDSWLEDEEKKYPIREMNVPDISIGDVCKPEVAAASPSENKTIKRTAAQAIQLATMSAALIEDSIPEQSADVKVGVKSDKIKTTPTKPEDVIAIEKVFAEVRAGQEKVDKPAKTKSRLELITEARSALKAKQEGALDRFDLARFAIESELQGQNGKVSQARYDKLKITWDKKESKYRELVEKTAGSTDDKIKALMRQLHREYLSSYTRSNAKLTDFLSGSGGNCEAESMLILSALRATGLIPEDDRRKLGLQVFSDHVQAVLYDPDTKSAWNLLTGTKQTTLRAPVYDPLVFAQGYLKAHDAESPLSVQELLIANIDLAKLPGALAPHPTKYKTNTGLALPNTASPVAFSDGPVPAFSRLGDFLSEGGEEGGNIQSSLTPQYEKYEKTLTLDEVPANERPMYETIFWDSYMGSRNSKFAIFHDISSNQHHQYLVFKDPELKNQYSELQDDSSRAQYLAQLAEESFKTTVESADTKRYLDYLKNPTNSDCSNCQAARFRYHHDLAEAVNRRAIVEAEGFNSPESQEQVEKVLEAKYPVIAGIRQANRILSLAVEKNPEAFLKHFSKLANPEKVLRFSSDPYLEFQSTLESMEYLMRGDDTYEDFKKGRAAWSRLLGDSKKVGLNITPPGRAGRQSTPKKQTEQSADEETKLPLPPHSAEEEVSAIVPKQGKKKISTQEKKDQRPILIPAVDLALSISSMSPQDDKSIAKGLSSQWTPDLTQELLDGNTPFAVWYFLTTSYSVILDARPANESRPYSGPLGDKIPRDIAQGLLKAISSLRAQPTTEGNSWQPTQDLEKILKEKTGLTIDEYVTKLRRELKL